MSDALIPSERAWRARSSAGRKPLFDSPDELFERCMDYLDWTADNPRMAAELVKFQGESKVAYVPKMRAPTIVGLCRFLDMSRQTWSNYKAKEEFLDTCERVEDAIYQEKVEGAAADLLNPGFIGREVGMVDRSSVDQRVTLVSEEAVRDFRAAREKRDADA